MTNSQKNLGEQGVTEEVETSNKGLDSLEEVFAQITHPKKRRFLEHYPRFKRINKTSKAIGIERRTFYNWEATDDVFKRAFRLVKDILDRELLEKVEAELEKRALKGVSKMSDVLLMFMAKALRPEVYREKAPDTRLTGEVTIKLALPGRRYEELPECKVIEGEVIEGEVVEGNHKEDGT